MKRVLWFYSDKTGCGTYRSYFPGLFLQQYKLADVDLMMQRDVVTAWLRADSHKDDPVEAAKIGGLAPADYECDVMVFQRAAGGPFPAIMKECKRRGIGTIFELDDDLFCIPRTNPAKSFWDRTDIRRDLLTQLELADRIITSTVPLAESVASEMGWPNWRNRISVCPNHLHPDIWGEDVLSFVTPHYTGGQIVIGWQGSTTHETDFKVAAKALATVAERYPQTHFRFFGMLPDPVRETVPAKRRSVVKGVPFEAYPGTLRFMGFSIGIAPLTPCKFNFAKSNLKWLEYSALRIPCVASKVYPYSNSIVHGRTGMLAETPADWVTCLSELVENEPLRRQIANAAYEDVWNRYSALAQGPTWHRAIEALPLGVAV